MNLRGGVETMTITHFLIMRNSKTWGTEWFAPGSKWTSQMDEAFSYSDYATAAPWAERASEDSRFPVSVVALCEG